MFSWMLRRMLRAFTGSGATFVPVPPITDATLDFDHARDGTLLFAHVRDATLNFKHVRNVSVDD